MISTLIKYDFSRFLVSGGAATAVHYAAMTALVLAGIDPNLATATGAILGAIANYFLLFHWAFNSTRSHRQSVPRYLLVCATGWTLNLLFFYSAHNLMQLPVPVAQLFSTAVVCLSNYLLYRRAVFL
ncbi:GtrA family protein [Spongiibacter marinus]|uniref:GtrA family protein n=1 Tax=Spongiibacter marinus TaxID=354246 RepID=UPI003C5EC587